jgi:hypothetical protein
MDLSSRGGRSSRQWAPYPGAPVGRPNSLAHSDDANITSLHDATQMVVTDGMSMPEESIGCALWWLDDLIVPLAESSRHWANITIASACGFL